MSPLPSRRPEFGAGKPIPLDELRDACAEYDRRCREGRDYNKWLKVFRRDIRNDVNGDESQWPLNLEKAEHCRALLLWLNRWDAHMPTREPRHYSKSIERLGVWWHSLDAKALPSPASSLTD